MNYIIGMLILMAVATLIATFPLPSLAAAAIGAGYWFLKGRKGDVS